MRETDSERKTSGASFGTSPITQYELRLYSSKVYYRSLEMLDTKIAHEIIS